jgi:hypothetical protein
MGLEPTTRGSRGRSIAATMDWPGLLLDATVVECHSEKESAAPRSKGGFDLRMLGRGHPRTATGVDLGLHYPPAHRLPAQAELPGHRLRRRGHRRVAP